MNEAQQEYESVLKNIETLKIKKKALEFALKSPGEISQEIESIDKRIIYLGHCLRRAFSRVTRQAKHG